MATSSLALLLVIWLYAAAGALAVTYNVGPDGRWDVPSSGTNYTTWASRQRFVVGDTLVFSFVTRAHNVLQVSQSNYERCNTQSTIASYTSGPASVPLNTPGTFYYVCGVGQHCSLGQKMTVDVSAAATPTTPSSPPPTAGGPPTTNPPSTPAVPSAPGPSGSDAGTPPPPSPNAVPPAGLGKAAAIAAVALTASAAALLL